MTTHRVIEGVIKRLHGHYTKEIERDFFKEMPKFKAWHDREGMDGWECFSVPESNHYKNALEQVNPEDVVFDVGAGDLRFDLMLCEKVKRVYAVEVNPRILGEALKIVGYDIPKNLVVIRANAFDLELPSDVTVIVCLMIHRNHDFPMSWAGKKIINATHNGLYYADNEHSAAICIREGDP